MARVNHKLVKQRLNEKRSKITDKQFFSSRMLAGHFEDLAAAQTRRYHYNRRVRVNLYWKPKDAFTAATDNMQIRINTGHPLVTKVKGRENRYQLVCGMFAHELGHVLFTDFLSAQTYHNYLDTSMVSSPAGFPAGGGCTEREGVLGICQGGPKESADGPSNRGEHCQYH